MWGFVQQVAGEDAKRYNAVRLDSFFNVNTGELVSADAQTGNVSWKDKAGETKSASLGAHMIRIVPK